MMIGLCIRCKWREEAPYENCKDCPDHETGVCLMAEAYQKGREDAISDMLKVIDCDNTDCEDCEFFDYEDDLGQLVTYCKFKREVQIKEQKNDTI